MYCTLYSALYVYTSPFLLSLLSAVADTTVATWGGSSVASMLSVPQEDEGKDPTDPSLPQYQVDRHTPRNTRPLRRAYSPHDDQDSTIGKKIKLEPPGSGNAGTPNSKKSGKVHYTCTCIAHLRNDGHGTLYMYLMH